MPKRKTQTCWINLPRAQVAPSKAAWGEKVSWNLNSAQRKRPEERGCGAEMPPYSTSSFLVFMDHLMQKVEHGNLVRKEWGRTIPSLPLVCKRHGFGPKWGIVLGMYLILSKSLPAVGKTPGLKLSLANLAKCCNDQTWKSLRACQAIWQDLLPPLLSQVQPFY